jgi:23S rRNA (guanine745-N1)-methyltransferase
MSSRVPRPMLALDSSREREVHFSCPRCSESLLPLVKPQGLRCSNGHHIDLAREGYAYLMPSKRTKVSTAALGPEADAMVRASRAFCESGGFDQIATGVASEVVRALSQYSRGTETAHVLAAGCADGFFLRHVAALLEAEQPPSGGQPPVHFWGTDVSKLAVRYAARQQPSARFAVASPHQLPFADGSFDVVFSCFAPAPWGEFCRVLRPGGAVVVARAGHEHLQELRPLAGAPPWRASKELSQGFGESYARHRTVSTFTGQSAEHLLAMTPWTRNAPEANQQALRDAMSNGLTTTFDLIITTHRVWLGTANCEYEL